MKILVVCQRYYPEQFRITDICEQMAKDGHEVTVLTGLPNYPDGIVPKEYKWFRRRKENIHGVQVVRCMEIGRKTGVVRLGINYLSFLCASAWKTFFLKGNFDIVLVNQLSPVTMAVPGILYRALHKTKLYLYCLDLWPESLKAGGVTPQSALYKIMLKFSRWVYRHADRIAVTSTAFENYFRDVLKIDAPVTYLPQYAESLFEEAADPMDANFPEGIHLVFAGNVGDMQDVDTILRAAGRLRDLSALHIHIVGGGSRLQHCKELAQELALTNVHFYGQRPLAEMPAFYAAADAMLITLKDDPFISYTLPGKIQTYMSAKKCIIGCANGATQQAIEAANAGYCCAAGDDAQLEQCVRLFVNQIDQKEQYGQNAYAFYKKHFERQGFFDTLYRELREVKDDVSR